MMKKISILLIIFFISCSPVQVLRDKFDNSIHIQLFLTHEYIKPIYGKIEPVGIRFSKNYKNDNISDTILFCKFEGHDGEYLEGDTIELNIDKIIYRLKLNESRLGQYQQTSSVAYTMFTRIGAFTFQDSSRQNINILAMETILPQNILDAILKSKSLMLRIYTKNINGISKNAFDLAKWDTLDDIKKFINYSPQQ